MRIGKIEGLEHCKNLKKLFMRQNLIRKIEGLENNTELEELELYDNKIAVIENISHLTKLKYITSSFYHGLEFWIFLLMLSQKLRI
jgi:protein phosphatase 1 regulatory subunit 7